MVKPIPLMCGKNRFVGEDGRPIYVDEVLTAAYEFEGQTMQFAVNYNNKPVTVKTSIPVTVYMDSGLQKKQDAVVSFTIPPLSAVGIQRG